MHGVHADGATARVEQGRLSGHCARLSLACGSGRVLSDVELTVHLVVLTLEGPLASLRRPSVDEP